MAAAEVPSPNARAHPYRGLSVQHVDQTPTPDFVREYLIGREVYRRTDYLALIHEPRPGVHEVALAAVGKESTGPLFSPATEVRVWSGPEATLWVEDAAVDVGNATALAETASAHHRRGVSGYVIKGMFEHVNFIWEPAPIRINVTELTPPNPPKLAAQARQVVEFDEDLPPIALVPDIVSFADLASAQPTDSYLLPCRGAGTTLPGRIAFLDTRPALRDDWLLIGCERSMQLHRHFYGDEPPQIDICPRVRVAESGDQGLWLLKCCMLERGIAYQGGQAVVPWGANLDEVRQALRLLVGIEQVEVPGEAELARR